MTAQLHVSRGEAEQAKAALRRLAEQGESGSAVLPLLRLLWERGEADEASELLEGAIARFPGDANLLLLRAENLLDQGLTDEARSEIGRFAAATFEGDSQVEYLEARLDLALGDAQGAADGLRELAPRLDRSTTQYWLGRALEESGDLEGARRRYQLAQQRDRAWPAPAGALLALDQGRGDWRAVAGHARSLVRARPHDMAGWAALVDALEQLGDGKAAEHAARQSVEQFPDQAHARVLLAKALRAQGETDEALAALDEALALGASAAEVTPERVIALGKGGRTEEGIALARRVLAQDPDAAPLHAALAALLFATGAAEEGARAPARAPPRFRRDRRAGAQSMRRASPSYGSGEGPHPHGDRIETESESHLRKASRFSSLPGDKQVRLADLGGPSARRDEPMTRQGKTLLRGLPCLVLVALLALPAAVEAAATDRPNILAIWGDDIGMWNISAYHRGMLGGRTPNIDRIANEGAIFTDYYAEQSCTAGRSAFITGQHPLRTGLLKVGMPGADIGLRPEDPTLAELLKPQGYATGQFGKNHLGDNPSSSGSTRRACTSGLASLRSGSAAAATGSTRTA